MIRGVDQWGVGYVRSVLSRPRDVSGVKHLLFCVADHFEPFRREPAQGSGRPDAGAALARVRPWVDTYAGVLGRFRDADGRPPRHTFFYPAEDYDASCLEAIAGLCGRGFGEVEVHLHHRNDTVDGLAGTLQAFRDRLRGEHGLLGGAEGGAPVYGFVHGNWALCNSRPDGDWCGVNEELSVLSRTGCYADFTFPSAPSPTQPRTVNRIYYARDLPGAPRGHDSGRLVSVGGEESSDLMLIQGPLAMDWRRRKWGVLPRLESGELSGVNPPLPGRVDLWARQHVHVQGRPEWVFVKVHTHGCVERNRRVLFGGAMQRAHEYLSLRYNDGVAWRLHYVTAREMYNIAKAAESGESGDPNAFRDFRVAPPPRARA